MPLTISQLIACLEEARARLLELVSDLDDQQMIGPLLAIVNPLRWEIAHVAFFQEFWSLRHLRGMDPIYPEPSAWPSDKMYDSARVAHDTRWDLPLPSKRETIDYMSRILDRVIDETLKSDGRRLVDPNGYDEAYFLHLSLLHEDMHNEAITYTRQTLGCSAPMLNLEKAAAGQPGSSPAVGDAYIPGGGFLLGAKPGSGFVFDNEQWAHQITVAPFSISRTAVSNGEFAAFVVEGGYRHREFWSQAGWDWRESVAAAHPVYWKCGVEGQWMRRVFDQWVGLEERLPVIHVNWYEAAAYCRWAGRRLPTEAEWEMAAACELSDDGIGIGAGKRVYPWGDHPPGPECANLDWRALKSGFQLPVDALPAGDSAFGCRQMIGNVWEWTASDFLPYPGFEPGPYREYSAPWFGDHKVLRGGCWATRSRLIRNQYRNFYRPDRRDVWAGFRTCAA